jgi:hypothetical protein
MNLRRFHFLAALLMAGALTAGARMVNVLTAEEQAAGWVLLFDGKSTAGWRGYKKPSMPDKGWRVEDGLLKKVAGERGGDIITERKFTNFELTWEWRLAPGANNGLKYLVTEDRPNAPGHEYQLIDDAANADAAKSPKRMTASFYDVLPPATDKPLKPAGQWNQSRLLVKGSRVEHWLNGAKVLEYELGSEPVKTAIAGSKFKGTAGFGEKIAGHIMLTDHGDECWFRSLKARELQVN